METSVVLKTITAAMILLWPAGTAAGAGRVEVTRDAERMETVYALSSGPCQIRMALQESELNRGILLNQSRCGLTWSEQVPLFAEVLQTIFSDSRSAGTIRTLSAGRLESYPELSRALAESAAGSARWDAANGKPKSGTINRFVSDLSTQSKIQQQWQSIFERVDRTVMISGVEKVLVSRASKLPFYPELKAKGVRSSDKLPYDCQLWLKIQPRSR